MERSELRGKTFRELRGKTSSGSPGNKHDFDKRGDIASVSSYGVFEPNSIQKMVEETGLMKRVSKSRKTIRRGGRVSLHLKDPSPTVQQKDSRHAQKQETAFSATTLTSLRLNQTVVGLHAVFEPCPQPPRSRTDRNYGQKWGPTDGLKTLGKTHEEGFCEEKSIGSRKT